LPSKGVRVNVTRREELADRVLEPVVEEVLPQVELCHADVEPAPGRSGQHAGARAQPSHLRWQLGPELTPVLDRHVNRQRIGLISVPQVVLHVERELAADRVRLADQAVRVVLPQHAPRSAESETVPLADGALPREIRIEDRRSPQEARLRSLVLLEIAARRQRAIEEVRVCRLVRTCRLRNGIAGDGESCNQRRDDDDPAIAPPAGHFGAVPDSTTRSAT
jgi:hypothetical protein